MFEIKNSYSSDYYHQEMHQKQCYDDASLQDTHIIEIKNT